MSGPVGRGVGIFGLSGPQGGGLLGGTGVGGGGLLGGTSIIYQRFLNYLKFFHNIIVNIKSVQTISVS